MESYCECSHERRVMNDSYDVQKFGNNTDNLLKRIVQWQEEAQKLLKSNEERSKKIRKELKRSSITKEERVHFEFEQSQNEAERYQIIATINSVLNQMKDVFDWQLAADELNCMKNVVDKMHKQLKTKH